MALDILKDPDKVSPYTVDWARDMLSLNEALSGSNTTVHASQLARAQKVLADAGEEAGCGNYNNALQWFSRRGGKGGRTAAFYQQQISMKEVDTQAGKVTARGSDDIARAYQNMGQQLTGMLGADVDVSSPAVLDTARRYIEGRSTDTARYAGTVETQAINAKNAIRLGQIAPTLVETGDLISALKMLDQEQESLRRAQMLNAGVQLGSSIIPAVV